jgi:hypothetical protein
MVQVTQDDCAVKGAHALAVDRSKERVLLSALRALGYNVDDHPRFGHRIGSRMAYQARKTSQDAIEYDWVHTDYVRLLRLIGLDKDYCQHGLVKNQKWLMDGSVEWCYELTDPNNFVVCEVRLWAGEDPYPAYWKDDLQPTDAMDNNNTKMAANYLRVKKEQ